MFRKSLFAFPVLYLLTCGGCGGGNEYVDPEVSDPRAAEIQADTKVLIERLNNKNPDARILVIGALKRLGAKAKDAVPALEKLRDNDPEQRVRTAAAEAIEGIQIAG